MQGFSEGRLRGSEPPKVNGEVRERIWYSEVGLISQGGIMSTWVDKLAATRDPLIREFA